MVQTMANPCIMDRIRRYGLTYLKLIADIPFGDTTKLGSLDLGCP